MAEHFLPIGLAAVNPAVDNYEKAWHPVKNQAKKIPAPGRRKSKKNRESRENRDDRDDRDDYGYDDRQEEMRSPEERGLVLKPRREVASDEEIVEIVPKGQLTRRPDGAMTRRASSMDGSQRGYRGRGRDREERDYYDSESSVSPKRSSRAGRGQAKSRQSGQTTELRSRSSSSSSSIMSSTEDEKNRKKERRKKWITTGLAGVATVHAAAKIYNSLDARDKRHLELARGDITAEEARKKRNEGRWQDAAAVGIAALGIRGAMGEWHEVEEKREEYHKARTEQKMRHEKRVARMRRAREMGYEPKIGHNRSKSTNR